MLQKLCLLVLLGGCAALPGCSPSREDEVNSYLQSHPETDARVAEAMRRLVVIVGMTPVEAHMAGGGCAFSLKADPKWPDGTDPWSIMSAQTEHPDKSVIELHFCNRAQFSTWVAVGFTAHVENGRVAKIERG